MQSLSQSVLKHYIIFLEHHPQKKPFNPLALTLLFSSLPLPSPQPALKQLLSFLSGFSSSGLSYEWNHRVCGLL